MTKANKAKKTTTTTPAMECHCIIKHPVNAEERAVVKDNLAYCRRIGDSQGTMITLAQLQGCPSLEG